MRIPFLFSLGAFWVAAAFVLGRQMLAGRFRALKALHQDLAPEAPDAGTSRNAYRTAAALLLIAVLS